jgi:hypothetical protein
MSAVISSHGEIQKFSCFPLISHSPLQQRAAAAGLVGKTWSVISQSNNMLHGSRLLLHARRRMLLLQDLYIRRDIEGPDRGERQAALLAPGEEPGACPGMGPVRVRVADVGGEEFDIAPAGVIPEIGDQRRHDRRHAQVRRCDARNFEPCSNRALPSRRQGSLRSEIPPHRGQRTIYRPHWESELGMPAARDDINYLNSRCGPVIGPDQSRRAATGQPAKDTDYSNRKYRVSFPRPDAEEGVSRVRNLPDWN